MAIWIVSSMCLLSMGTTAFLKNRLQAGHDRIQFRIHDLLILILCYGIQLSLVSWLLDSRSRDFDEWVLLYVLFFFVLDVCGFLIYLDLDGLAAQGDCVFLRGVRIGVFLISFPIVLLIFIPTWAGAEALEKLHGK